jgi:hypothetical protein
LLKEKDEIIKDLHSKLHKKEQQHKKEEDKELAAALQKINDIESIINILISRKIKKI